MERLRLYLILALGTALLIGGNPIMGLCSFVHSASHPACCHTPMSPQCPWIHHAPPADLIAQSSSGGTPVAVIRVNVGVHSMPPPVRRTLSADHPLPVDPSLAFLTPQIGPAPPVQLAWVVPPHKV